MQFLAYHNAPQNYNDLAENNFIFKDDHNNQIHKPFLSKYKQSNSQFHTNYNSKTSHDQMDYSKQLRDNFYDPIYNDQIVHHSNFISNKSQNPYQNGDAQHFFNYNPNQPYTQDTPPYANNYGTYDPTGNWDPYINPQNNLTNYLSQQVVKDSDRKQMIERNRANLNTNYPGEVNPYNDFIKDFNPSDNFVEGDSNFNLSSGNDIPLNKLIPAANKNVPPDAPPGINTGNPTFDQPEKDLMSQSVRELAHNLGKTSLDTINDVVRYIGDDSKDPSQLWNIFTKPDRIAYVGILVIILAILMAVLI